MKKNILIWMVILSFLLPAFAQNDTTFGNNIVVEKDEIQDNVLSFGGNVLIEGKVRESVVIFGGKAEIKGEVGEAVIGFGSEIKLYPSARIKGDVVVLGGHFERDIGSVVEGDTIYFGNFAGLSNIFSQIFRGLFSLSFVPIVLILKLLNIFIWFILAIILIAIFPNQISFASSQIEKKFWTVAGVGMLGILIFTGLTLLSVILSFLIIGIPILFLLILAGFIIQFFGRVVLFYFFGEKFLQAFNWKPGSQIVIVIVGVAIVSLIRFIPVIGLLFALCLSILGWGVVLKTRFGTR
ncbi:hypothetical protein NLC82_03425 [Candidatus Aminicenantes bacterium AC-335-A11]|jgi:hypothetical protein|nr:hypothetical protein [SCandidatus Aminicenantes bacterium Aminicenantia_JdfR_composite]MCP2618449.1 hypothetical protein [Candidatus Aminicenantes bacterium AC-335-A11]